MSYFFIITSFLIFIPSLFGIYFYRQLPKKFQIFVIYLSIFSFVELFGFIVGRYQINTRFLLHILVILEFALIGLVFHFHFENWLPTWAIPSIISIFIILSISNSIFIQPLTAIPSNIRYLETILLILLSLAYLYQVFTELKIEKLWEEGMFCFSIGLLVYYSGTMMLYLSSNYLMKANPQYFLFFYQLIQSVCHLIMYLLFTLALWQEQKK